VKRIRFGIALVIAGSFVLLASTGTQAYRRYQDGCNIAACHGSFTDDTSTKGSVFPGGDKHSMHRASQNMNIECNLCHRTGDGNNPYIGLSDGTDNNPGIGCNGCHDGNGLRAHHMGAGVTFCNQCHTDSAPLPEDTVPTYYGTADVAATMVDPCNLSASTETDENWTVGDLVGLDNDGDGLYDGDDPDCAATSQSPGEMRLLTVASHDSAAQSFSVSYDATTCGATSNNLLYGPLGQVSTYAYTGEDCSIGASGSYTFDYSAIAESIYFLIVAHNDTNEGSYGTDAAGTERPDALRCPEPQSLIDTCTQ
jgi:hypothetical protein